MKTILILILLCLVYCSALSPKVSSFDFNYKTSDKNYKFISTTTRKPPFFCLLFDTKPFKFLKESISKIFRRNRTRHTTIISTSTTKDFKSKSYSLLESEHTSRHDLKHKTFNDTNYEHIRRSSVNENLEKMEQTTHSRSHLFSPEPVAYHMRNERLPYVTYPPLATSTVKHSYVRGRRDYNFSISQTSYFYQPAQTEVPRRSVQSSSSGFEPKLKYFNTPPPQSIQRQFDYSAATRYSNYYSTRSTRRYPQRGSSDAYSHGYTSTSRRYTRYVPSYEFQYRGPSNHTTYDYSSYRLKYTQSTSSPMPVTTHSHSTVSNKLNESVSTNTTSRLTDHSFSRVHSTRHDTYPTTRHDTYPTTRHDTYPTIRHDTYPTTRHDTYPTTRHDTYPTTRHDTYPTTRHDPYPTTRHDPYLATTESKTYRSFTTRKISEIFKSHPTHSSSVQNTYQKETNTFAPKPWPSHHSYSQSLATHSSGKTDGKLTYAPFTIPMIYYSYGTPTIKHDRSSELFDVDRSSSQIDNEIEGIEDLSDMMSKLLKEESVEKDVISVDESRPIDVSDVSYWYFVKRNTVPDIKKLIIPRHYGSEDADRVLIRCNNNYRTAPHINRFLTRHYGTSSDEFLSQKVVHAFPNLATRTTASNSPSSTTEEPSSTIATFPTYKFTATQNNLDPYGLIRKIMLYNMIRRPLLRNATKDIAPSKLHPINQLPPYFNLPFTLSHNHLVFTADNENEHFTLLGKYRIHKNNKTLECIQPPSELSKPFNAVAPTMQSGFYRVIQKYRINQNNTLEIIANESKIHSSPDPAVSNDTSRTIAVELRFYPLRMTQTTTYWKNDIPLSLLH